MDAPGGACEIDKASFGVLILLLRLSGLGIVKDLQDKFFCWMKKKSNNIKLCNCNTNKSWL